VCSGTAYCRNNHYIIPLNKLPNWIYNQHTKKWIQRHKGLPVDLCIGEEIEQLILNNVRTYGCCCGHGEYPANCLIDIKSIDICKNLGYSIEEHTPEWTQAGIYKICLKTRIRQSKDMERRENKLLECSEDEEILLRLLLFLV
jgi:hypothetical protein